MTTAPPARHPIPPEVMLSSWVALWDELIGSPQDDAPQPEPQEPQAHADPPAPERRVGS